jgi:hypothetical protein
MDASSLEIKQCNGWNIPVKGINRHYKSSSIMFIIWGLSLMLLVEGGVNNSV